MKTIVISEQQYRYYIGKQDTINEDVFATTKNDRSKQAQLTYQKNNSSTTGKRMINRGNLNSQDMLKTDKMDASGHDTYEVPLKGGIMSYNITSINGTEVMHYFKRSFEKNRADRETSMKIGGNDYKLDMEDREFQQFKENFNDKVDAVTNWKINEFKQENNDIEFTKVSIYPVPSSSQFNIKMAQELANGGNICGLPCQVIDSSILRKDTTNLQKDEEFIEKNKDYYNSKRIQGGNDNRTHLDVINTSMGQLVARSKIPMFVEKLNNLSHKIISRLNQNRKEGNWGDLALKNVSELYREYCDIINNLRKEVMYVDHKGEKHKLGQSWRDLIEVLKYSKQECINNRTQELFGIIKSSPYGKWLNKQNMVNLCDWQPINFQIKSLGNDVRMGLKNYFQPNSDMNRDLIQQEVEKTKGGIVVIFDDNVSGGATLGDICLQLQNLGMEYIIPITFGQMRTSWNVGALNINRPKDGKFNI